MKYFIADNNGDIYAHDIESEAKMTVSTKIERRAGMKKLISKEAALSSEVYSRDLREYVVPSREIKRLREYDEPTEQAKEVEEMLRVLFNRCMTLSHGSLCIFCGIRDACDMRRDVWKRTVKKNETDKMD